jgi:hypothetical protein
VSSSETWSPEASETVHSSSSAAIVELEICSSASWNPVQRAQLVDDRALDAGDRVGLELDLALELEALDRGDQPAEAVGDEVGLLDVRRQPGRHAAGDVLDERGIGDDEALAGAFVPVTLVAPPQILQLDRFDVRFHPCP